MRPKFLPPAFLLLLAFSARADELVTAPLLVEKTSGVVEIESPFRPSRTAKPGEALLEGERILTGAQGSAQLRFLNGARVEVGVESALRADDLGQGRAGSEIFLIAGRMRTMLRQEGRLRVRTPSAGVVVFQGVCDIILNNMNTLTAPREGKDVEVSTLKARKRVPPGKYVLVTVEGDLLISDPAAQQTKKEKVEEKKPASPEVEKEEVPEDEKGGKKRERP